MLESYTPPSLGSLLQIDFDQRDLQWELKFFDHLLQSRVEVMNEEPQPGPDGFIYLLTSTEGEETTEPVIDIVKWLAERGIGLVINPQKDYPDYVFSYGMLWYYKETGFFVNSAAQIQSHGAFEIKPDGSNAASGQSHYGEPSEDYLPAYVRKLVREFLQQQAVLTPRVLMVSEDKKAYDLAFSIESLGNPPEKEHEGILTALSWFLPPHYSLALVSEKGLPKFVAL